MASLSYWVLHARIAMGSIDDVGPVVEALRYRVPSAISVRTTREENQPWGLVSLTMPLHASVHDIEATAEELRRLPEVEDLWIEHRHATLGRPDVPPSDDKGKRYASLVAELALVFFVFDPMGINFGDNTDEYEPEVGTVLPRLRSASSVEDVARILQEEFERWFGGAGRPEHYEQLAHETWRLWQEARL